MDIDLEYVATIFKQTNHIGQITLSGGEPSLNIQAIRSIFRMAEDYGIEIESFYIATNALSNQLALATLLIELYDKMPDKENCSASISQDVYHEGWGEQETYLKALKFYSNTKEHESYDMEKWVIKRGRAEMNGIGHPPFNEASQFEINTYFDKNGNLDKNLSVDMVYLSCNGWAYSDCDLSYEEMGETMNQRDDAECEACPAKDLLEFLVKKAST